MGIAFNSSGFFSAGTLRSKRSCAFLGKGKPRNPSRSASELTRSLADLNGFLGFPFPKNAQERLLRRLFSRLYTKLIWCAKLTKSQHAQ